ncbi:MAG: CopG family transcriptional regulator [Burkholderiales bacterium]
MRTTLDIDDDVLNAAKELARREQVSAGQIVSRMLRDALTGKLQAARGPSAKRARVVAGFRPFAPRGQVVTNDAVNQWRDDEGV